MKIYIFFQAGCLSTHLDFFYDFSHFLAFLFSLKRLCLFLFSSFIFYAALRAVLFHPRCSAINNDLLSRVRKCIFNIAFIIKSTCLTCFPHAAAVAACISIDWAQRWLEAQQAVVYIIINMGIQLYVWVYTHTYTYMCTQWSVESYELPAAASDSAPV